jgi:sodium pump decarboxylase gamma subunit
MIFEGIKLAIIGIFFVYTFLCLLVWVMGLSAAILRPYTQQEEREQAIHRKGATAVNAFLKDGRLAAAICAAIAVHRRRARRQT